ncbi:MAG: zinc ribbon domain-containing protein [Deltaproteobacteria bacterium]|nr:zinc ribbon domain-containing protein [Deltaproteobacteria bacterium]
MPIYEYKCSGCGETTEIIQKFSDKPLTKCSHCSGKLARLISNCSFHLKGTGWYVTDYKKGDTGKKEKHPEPKKPDPPKSDTPATKSEDKKS